MTTADPQLTTAEGRSAVVVRHRFPHPPQHVWRGITETDSLAAWFPGAAEIEPRIGGTVRYPGAEGTDAGHGTVLACDPPHLLAFTWDTDTLTFTLEADGDGTVLTLTHAFDDHAGAASFATGWEACLAGLAQVADGAEVTDPGPQRDRHEELARRFELGAPVVLESSAGWSVRFERQLVCDAVTAWELFLTGADPVDPAPVQELVIGGELRAPKAPEVVLGEIRRLDPPHLLAFAPGSEEPGDEVRLELRPGTGHGARLVLTVDGTEPAEREAAIEQWGSGAVEAIAAAALRVG